MYASHDYSLHAKEQSEAINERRMKKSDREKPCSALHLLI